MYHDNAWRPNGTLQNIINILYNIIEKETRTVHVEDLQYSETNRSFKQNQNNQIHAGSFIHKHYITANLDTISDG